MDPINQKIEEEVLTPLRQARQSLADTDASLQQALQRFSTNIMQLFTGDNAFRGEAADAVAQLAGQYLDAEMSGRANGVQAQLPALFELFEGTAAHLQQEIDWYYSELWPGDGPGAVPNWEGSPCALTCWTLWPPRWKRACSPPGG